MESTAVAERTGSPRTVLITGVSRGCGRAMAIELAHRGHTIVGCARSEAELATLRKECPRPNGQQHLFSTLDVTSDAGVKELALRVVEACLMPDIIVNNAAVMQKNNKTWDVPPEEVDLVVDVNIKGTINVLRHFLPVLIKRGRGIVVNVSSIWGRTVVPDVASYCATKWAVEGLSRAVSMEVPPEIAVVALDPGVIYTDMSSSCLGNMAASKFPTPDAWAPTAVDMLLNFKAADNGTSPTVPIVDKKATSVWDSIKTEIVHNRKL